MKAAEMSDDERLAVEVMGWGQEDCGCCYSDNEGNCYRVRDWSPRTNIEQAFMLVEKMRERGYDYLLCSQDKNRHSAEFWNMAAVKPGYEGKRYIGDTPAEAICNAIIKTLEGL